MNPHIFGDEADHRELARTLFPADTIKAELEETAEMLRSEQVAAVWDAVNDVVD